VRTSFVFGAGAISRTFLPLIQKEYKVVGFLDNDKTLWGKVIEGIVVYPPQEIMNADYDMVFVNSTTSYQAIIEQLLEMGVERGKTNADFVTVPVKSRILFLEKLGLLFQDDQIGGCVAEGGVFQGEFAKEINRVFSNKTLFLFDTFSGFDVRDTEIEQKKQYSEATAGRYNITSEALVMSKMPHPERCVIRKGYFPETTEGINETFCFVNLDFDLFLPVLSGLEYFVPRMEKKGVILIHDYFSEGYKGGKEAVKEYCKKAQKELHMFPIGDGISIGIKC